MILSFMSGKRNRRGEKALLKKVGHGGKKE